MRLKRRFDGLRISFVLDISSLHFAVCSSGISHGTRSQHGHRDNFTRVGSLTHHGSDGSQKSGQEKSLTKTSWARERWRLHSWEIDSWIIAGQTGLYVGTGMTSIGKTTSRAGIEVFFGQT